MGAAGSDERPLPGGTVTFLLTDLEVSTDLWERHGEVMAEAIREHDDVIERAVAARAGTVFKHVGDGACAAFATADAAMAAAVEIQQELQARRWPGVGTLRARIGIHTGPAMPSVPPLGVGDRRVLGEPLSDVHCGGPITEPWPSVRQGSVPPSGPLSCTGARPASLQQVWRCERLCARTYVSS